MSIIKEIEQYPFEHPIIIEADRINQSMNRYVNRGKKRTLKLLYCIYNAHLNLGKVADIYIIGKQMNIESKHIRNTFKICSPFRTGYKYKKIRFDVFDYLELYLSYIQASNSSHQQQIYHLAKVLTEKYSLLSGEYPSQKLAASFIIYYARINGIDEIAQEMKDLFYRPTTTLESIIKKISDLVNY